MNVLLRRTLVVGALAVFLFACIAFFIDRELTLSTGRWRRISAVVSGEAWGLPSVDATTLYPGVINFDVSVPSIGMPVRLKIPRIQVDAAIEYVGVTAAGAMEVPRTIFDVGWFDRGPRPGENGSAVIAGHFNGEHGEAGVFTDLSKLKQGDKVYIENDAGVSIAFVVRESRTYSPGYADEVFRQSDTSHLNLITCDGVWDEVTKSYSKRLVVFADIVS